MKRRDALQFMGVAGLSGLLSACGGGAAETSALPRIDHFGSDKSSYRRGERVVLRAAFQGERARLDPGSLDIANGVDIEVGPLQATTLFRLTVTSRGVQTSRELRVTVVPEAGFVAIAMGFSRSRHVAVPGLDGHVYFLGGEGGGGAPPTAVFGFNDGASTFTHVGELLSGRTGHLCVPLGDGTILVLGGSITTSGAPQAERFDPRSGRSRATATQPAYRRSQHTATMLPDGRVLVVGGRSPGQVNASDTMELFDPVTEAFSVVPAQLRAGRFGHAAALATSRMLVIYGGITPTGAAAPPELLHLDSWSSTLTEPPVPATASCVDPIAVVSQTGAPLFIGGEDHRTGQPAAQVIEAAGVTPPRVAANLREPRLGHAAAALADGRVLVTGGSATAALAALASTEVFVPASGRMEAGPDLLVARTHHTATLLPGGRLLVAGGLDRSGTVIGTAELYG